VTETPAPPLPDWIGRLLPAGHRRYRVAVDERAMHVLEVGEGRPVLLLHGNPTWSFLYRKVAAELAAAPLRLIVPDLVGLGFSDKPRDEASHTLESHERWASRLVEALDLDRYVLVVQDWGGPIGGLAAASAPARVAGWVARNLPPLQGMNATRIPRHGARPRSHRRGA